MVVSVQHGRPAPHGADQRRALTNHRQADGVQAGDGRLPHLAAAEGENELPKVVAGVTFRDGTEVTASPDHRAA